MPAKNEAKKSTGKIESHAPGTHAPGTFDRRGALIRLGLATGLAYSAPTLLQVDRNARAGVLPSFCPPPGSPIPPPPGCEPEP